MLDAVNSERAARSLPPLLVDRQLSEIARAHARDMVARGYYGHVTPEGRTLRDRLEDDGLAPGWVGENYFHGHVSAGEIVETAIGWFMDDPPHRDNVLHERYTRLGVGFAEGPSGDYILVLDFAGEQER